MAEPAQPHKDESPITIKKYANRRLYNTATSTYVTLDHLSQMVKAGADFVVYDAKTGEDITRQVLTHIIVEEEGKGGQNMLPIGFLRQLISFYGDNLQSIVPRYLETSMQLFARNQEQMREYLQGAFGNLFPFQAQFEQASGQLVRDQALLANAQLDLARYRDLLAKDSIARQQVDAQEALVRNGSPAAEFSFDPGYVLTTIRRRA